MYPSLATNQSLHNHPHLSPFLFSNCLFFLHKSEFPNRTTPNWQSAKMNKNTTTNLNYIQNSETVPSLSMTPAQAPLATISVTDVPPLNESSYSEVPAALLPPSNFDDEAIRRQDDHNYSVFGNTLTEPVEETIKRDLLRIVSNLKLVVLPNPFREDPGKALRDWDLWGPFFFIVFLGLALSWSAAIQKADVFALAFGVLASGAVVLTMNIALLGGKINFFQSISLLGYCLFPLDVGAVLCFLLDFSLILRMWVVFGALAWSCWAAYPFMSTAVHENRKALALYPVLLMYLSVAFLIIAIA